MIRKILVPIDGSKPSEDALDYALDIAQKYNATIEVLGVIPATSLASIAPWYGITEETVARPLGDRSEVPAWMDSYMQESEKGYQKVLSKALKKARKKQPNLKVATRLEKGRPADKIVEIAKDEKFDLIVIGSRGLGSIKEFFLGSISHRVADKATCPVLIVK